MSEQHTTPYRSQPAPYPPVRSPRAPVSLPVPQQFPPRFPQPVPPRRPPGQRARLVLLVACVLALAAAGVFGTLYVAADSDHDAAVTRLEEERSRLGEVRERLATAQDAQEGAEERNGDLEAEKTALTTCVDAVQRYLWDGLAGAARDAAIDAMFTACQ